MSLLKRFTPDELEYLAGLPDGDPDQKLAPEEIVEARALVAQIDAGVEFIGEGATAA